MAKKGRHCKHGVVQTGKRPPDGRKGLCRLRRVTGAAARRHHKKAGTAPARRGQSLFRNPPKGRWVSSGRGGGKVFVPLSGYHRRRRRRR